MSRLLARLGDADVILVWKLDRLARSFLSFADLMRDCDRAGVALTSATEPLDTTSPMGRAMVQMTAVFAELERSMIRERIRDSRAYLATTERHWSGRPPYGLKIVPAPDGKGKILERDEEAAEVIREIVARLIEGESGSSIAEDLQRRGVTPPRMRTALKPNPAPSAWSFPGIRKILEHPSILGHRVDDRGHVRRDETGAPIIFWEPIVSPEDLESARRAMRIRSSSRSAPQRRHWLWQVVVCGKCGRPMTQNANHGRAKLTLLRCNGDRRDPCRGVLVREADLSAWVEAEFLATVGHLEAVERVWVPGSEDPAPEIAQLDKAIARLRDDRDAGLFDHDPEDYRARVKAMTERRAALASMPVTEGRWENRPMGCTVAELWKRLDRDARGGLIRDMGLRVVVEPANRRRLPVAARARLEPIDPS